MGIPTAGAGWALKSGPSVPEYRPAADGRVKTMIALAGAVIALAASSLQPQIAVTGRYAGRWLQILRDAGAAVEQIPEASLSRPDVLARYRFLIIAHLHGGWRAEAENAVADWVRRGGYALLEIDATPPRAIVPYSQATSGWAPTFAVTDSRSMLGKAIGARRLRYGAWGCGLKLPAKSPARIVARWDLSDAAGYANPVHRRFAECDVAAIELRAGKGMLWWSGAGLFIIAPETGVRLVEAVLGPEALPARLVEKRWRQPLGQLPSANRGNGIVIFQDEAMPAPAMPPVSAEWMRRALQRAGFSVQIADADELSAGHWTSPSTGLLIIAQGEAFPLEAIVHLRRFLASGGRVISCAGTPCSRIFRKTQNGWQPLEPADAIAPRLAYLAFRHIGLLAKTWRADVPSAGVINLAPDLLDAPPWWNLSGAIQLFTYRSTGASPQLERPLAMAVRRDGTVLGAPATLSLLPGGQPKARWLALGFVGPSSPINPSVFPSADRFLVSLARLMLRRDFAVISDIWPEKPMYRPGHRPRIIVTVQSCADRPLAAGVELEVRQRSDGRSLFRQTGSARLQPWSPAQVQFRLPPLQTADWACVLTARIRPGLPGFDRSSAELLVWQPSATQAAPRLRIPKGGPALLGGRRAWLTGANLYTADPRSVGWFFTAPNQPLKHPTAETYDADLSLLRIFGGNCTRTHYFCTLLTPAELQRPDSEAALRLDAYNLLHAAHGIGAVYAPFTFLPGRTSAWRNYMAGRASKDADPYSDPAWLAEEERYYRLFARRCRQSGAVNIAFQLINEPDTYGPKQPTRRNLDEFARRIGAWARRMAAALAEEGYPDAGMGHTSAGVSPVWDPLGNLSFLNHFDVHSYSPGLWRVELGLQWGRPAVLGEFGMPNARDSRSALLGDWTAQYERLFVVLIAHRALGFFNFYLRHGLGHVDSPEWGMLRPDKTEKPSAIQWKRFNWLVRRLPPSEILPPDAAVAIPRRHLLDARARQAAAEAFGRLLARGIVAAILCPEASPSLRPSWLLVYEPAGQPVSLPSKLAAASKATVYFSAENAGEAAEALAEQIARSRPVQCTNWSAADGIRVRRLTGGRWLIAILGARQSPVEVAVAEHRYALHLPAGRSALLVVDGQGRPQLVMACGRVDMDGRLLCDGPAEGYAVCAPQGRSLLDAAPEIWAEDQIAVKLASGREPAGGSSRLPSRLRIAFSGVKSAQVRQAIAGILRGRGLLGPSRWQVVFAPASSKQGAVALRRAGLRFDAAAGRLFVRGAWIDMPWSGAIIPLPAARRIYAVALTEQALPAVALKLASLRSLEPCLTAPFVPLSQVTGPAR